MNVCGLHSTTCSEPILIFWVSDAVKKTLVKAGATVRSSALVGSHAKRYTVAPKT